MNYIPYTHLNRCQLIKSFTLLPNLDINSYVEKYYSFLSGSDTADFLGILKMKGYY